MFATSEATSASGGTAAVMLGRGALAASVVIAVMLLWPHRYTAAKWVTEAWGKWLLCRRLDAQAAARRDLDRAAARSTAGRGRYVG